MNFIRTAQIISVIVLLILFTSLLTGCVKNNSEEDNTDEESIDFTFTLLNGIKKSISEYRGKVVLIDFMGVACAPCCDQMFVLERLYSSYDSDDVVIISINVWVLGGESSAYIELLKTAYGCASPCDAEDGFFNLLNNYALGMYGVSGGLQGLKQYYSKQDGVELEWTFGLDDASGTLFYEYGNQGVPMIYLLDKNGNIYYSKGGYTDYAVLAGKIDELLE